MRRLEKLSSGPYTGSRRNPMSNFQGTLNQMNLRTCVAPDGQFIFGIHRPDYQVANFREKDFITPLGKAGKGVEVLNEKNFPSADLRVAKGEWIYEIPNPFPFRGTTFICKSWADAGADNPARISLAEPRPVSMADSLAALTGKKIPSPEELEKNFRLLPEPLLLTLASSSTDPRDLTVLAKISCDFIFDRSPEKPLGLRYLETDGGLRPVIHHHDLFETVANNYHLPDAYKEVMVLRPGAQGESEIVGEYGSPGEESHIFEYLRRNSYIPWGHYASNMANDAIRYRIRDLSRNDLRGLRHLYYQRTYVRLAELLGIPLPARRKSVTREELEELRISILAALQDGDGEELIFNATLWGWNFGYDFAASGYRLHASHQQVHQQFALLPSRLEAWHSGNHPASCTLPAYACGDLVADFCHRYRKATGQDFFSAYIRAIRDNRRMDGRNDANRSLIVYEDQKVMLFVPKAQTSQWELQLMTVEPVGNILEADPETRESIDHAMLLAQRSLAALGARLVTSIEFSKRVDGGNSGQRLLYSFLPKLPYSMGAFSEAQLRWINGHFPEDFAAACREKLNRLETGKL